MPAKGKASVAQSCLKSLESHLWEAANILRGPVDAADFKTYVFPLLFFKRISDVHDEEYDAAMKEFDGDEEAALFPENYGFQVPDGSHWRDVRKVAKNVGQALQNALRGIEQANPHTLLGMDLLEAVIGLGHNLFYGTGLAACILVFRQKKTKARKNKVLIVDASKEFESGRAQNELLTEHVERIHGWVRDYVGVEGIARVVSLDEIASNDHNLNIPRYVEPKVMSEVLTVEEAMKQLRESAEAAFTAEERLVGILKQEGLLV
jgi:type I restriction-modification system DNA methylase subunit